MINRLKRERTEVQQAIEIVKKAARDNKDANQEILYRIFEHLVEKEDTLAFRAADLEFRREDIRQC